MPHFPCIMIWLLASIFVKKFSRKFFAFARKFSYFRENRRENFENMRKWNFYFGPNDNWILTLPHIWLFYPPKMRCYGKKLHHMYHACRITVKFNGFFVFAKRNFAKIVPFSQDFRIFAKTEKCIFVSTRCQTQRWHLITRPVKVKQSVLTQR
jgi:hypothetical protein